MCQRLSVHALSYNSKKTKQPQRINVWEVILAELFKKKKKNFRENTVL